MKQLTCKINEKITRENCTELIERNNEECKNCQTFFKHYTHITNSKFDITKKVADMRLDNQHTLKTAYEVLGHLSEILHIYNKDWTDIAEAGLFTPLLNPQFLSLLAAQVDAVRILVKDLEDSVFDQY